MLPFHDELTLLVSFVYSIIDAVGSFGGLLGKIPLCTIVCILFDNNIFEFINNIFEFINNIFEFINNIFEFENNIFEFVNKILESENKKPSYLRKKYSNLRLYKGKNEETNKKGGVIKGCVFHFAMQYPRDIHPPFLPLSECTGHH